MCCGSYQKVRPVAERTPQNMGLFYNKHFPMYPAEHAEDYFRRGEYQSDKYKSRLKSKRNIKGLERFKGFPLPGETGTPGSGRSSPAPAPVVPISNKARASASQYPNLPLGTKRPSVGRFDRTPAYGWGNPYEAHKWSSQHPYQDAKRPEPAKLCNAATVSAC
ncbi:hypothetical protein FGADI_9205 [Fusarium gaditjirri]|uniref:Uncharacterized protein n=1 Tax=Fusarium gaditjirri TaxID=282569 RepID=A0A8H4T0A9_9HYPO|nr:hypothetical protein FGADI_9205 [Fusarium gaditjirri]